jgi:putative transcriptional regulator
MPFLAGSFLVARPVLQDPSFRRTVVLLLQHGPEGAFGVVVNRRGESEGLPFPVFTGGPCPSQGLIMLHGHPEWAELESETPAKAVAPGIFVGDSSCLSRVNDAPEGQVFRFRLFTGYAGWGPGQLEGELAAGAWSATSASGNALFDIAADELWDRLLPPRIPQPSVN